MERFARKIRRPSLPTAIALLALAVATTGTAAAATGQLVNIADGTNAARIAKVDGAGRLQTAVGGTVTAQQANPATLFTAATSTSSTSCVFVYSPPAGSGAIVTNLQGNAYSTPNPAGAVLRFFVSSTSTPCGNRAASFMSVATTPSSIAQDFSAGIAVPDGYALYVDQFLIGGSSGDSWIVSAQGYKLPAASVPPSAAKVSGRSAGPAGGVLGAGG